MIDVRITKKKSSTASGFNVAAGWASGSATAIDSTEVVMEWIRSLLVPVDEEGNELERDSETPIAALKAKYPFFSVGEVSALGYGVAGGGTSGPTTGVGINETELAEYLTNNGYATELWVSQNFLQQHQDLSAYLKSADAATLYQPKGNYLTAHQDISGKVDKVAGKGLSTNDFTTALLNKLNGIAEGANNYTHPTGGANSTIAAANGKVLSSITVNALGHVTAVGSKTLVSDDIPSLAISKITNLQTTLDSKLNASVFNDLFETKTINGKTVIRAKFSLYSDDELSAMGYGGSGSTGTEQPAVGINETDLADYLTKNGYATQTWVEAKNYATQSWVTANYQPKGSYLTGITKAQVEAVLTGNITTHTHSQYLTSATAASTYLTKTDASSTYLTKTSAATLYQPAGSYVTLNTVQEITGSKTFASSILTKGTDVVLGTSGSTSDDSGDLEWLYGNGQEKMRIYAANEFTTAIGPNYRVYKKDGTSLYSGRLATVGELALKLDASVFNELFEKTTVSGKTVIKAKFSLYSADELSALGYGGSGSTGTEQPAVGINKSELAEWLTQNGYATQSWVNGKLGNYVSIGSDGVSEVGRYLDFHTANYGTNTTQDYSVRLDAGSINTARAFTFPTTGGTLATEGFVTGKGYVDKTSAETISGVKTFNEEIYGMKGISLMRPRQASSVMGCIGFNRDTTDGTIANTGYSAFQFTHKDNTLHLEIFNSKGTPSFKIGCGIEASSFIKSGGTSSQLLAADGSTQSLYKAAEVTTATSDSGTITPYAMNQWTGKTYLKLTGGTLTGALTIKTGADTKLVFNNTDGEKYTRIGFQENGTNFGTLDVWETFFGFSNKVRAPYFEATGTTLCTNLNADLLDGLHAGSFLRYYDAVWNNGETVAAWSKRITSGLGIISAEGWAWASSANLTLGSYSIDRQKYSALDFRRGNLNNTWHQKAYLFLPTYSDQSMMYIAQMTVSGTAGEVTTAVKRYADYDTILASNVASASKLATTRTIWGQDFNGEGNVSGNMSSVGQISFSNATAPYIDSLCRVWLRQGGTNFEVWRYDGNKIMMIDQSKNATLYGALTVSSGVTCDAAYTKYLFLKNPNATKGFYLESPSDGSLYIGTHENYGGTGGVLILSQEKSARFMGRLDVDGTSAILGSLTLGGKDNNSALEIFHSTPYIDFHFGRSTADYTSRLIEYASGCVRLEGNFYSTGEVTALTTSDQRLKTNIRPITEAVRRLRALGGYSVYDYLPEANARVSTARIGLIAQKVQGNVGSGMLNTRPDGYLSLNYLHPDYINLIGAATLETADELTKAKAEIKRLKERVAKLEAR